MVCRNRNLRHILVHDYFAVDVEIMWLVIEDDIPVLKQQIQAYIAELDESEFKRAVVVLRRTFSEFSKNEKCDIAENLGEIWGFNKDQVADVLTHDMNVEEQKKLDELNDFDFDDI